MRSLMPSSGQNIRAIRMIQSGNDRKISSFYRNFIVLKYCNLLRKYLKNKKKTITKLFSDKHIFKSSSLTARSDQSLTSNLIYFSANDRLCIYQFLCVKTLSFYQLVFE